MIKIDRIIRGISHDGSVMIAALDTTETVYIAAELHQTTATASAAFGRSLTAASIMGSMLKSDNSTVTLKFAGDGPVQGVVAISDSKGNVRGYVGNPQADVPLRADGKLDVGGLVGHTGRMCVIKDFGSGEPYTGQIELVSGEIAEDVTNYYAVSEQVPTVCALGVLTDKVTHKVILSGGILIQVLPGAYETDIQRLENDVQDMETMTTMLAKGYSLEEICKKTLKSFEIDFLDETPIHYACTCSKEKYSKALITLGGAELQSLPTVDDNVEAVCPYCQKKYHFSSSDIQELIKIAKK